MPENTIDVTSYAEPREILENALALLAHADRLMARAVLGTGTPMEDPDVRAAYRYALDSGMRLESLTERQSQVVRELGRRIGF